MEAIDAPPVKRQGGFVRVLCAVFLLGFALSGVLVASGCAGTKAAYQEAQSLDEYAYVLTEHYASLVREAADLKERPTTPAAAVEAMQRADNAVRPFIVGCDGIQCRGLPPPQRRPGLRSLAESYKAIKSAENEAALQAAIDSAVLKIADLVRAVKSARGAP